MKTYRVYQTRTRTIKESRVVVVKSTSPDLALSGADLSDIRWTVDADDATDANIRDIEEI